MEEKAMRFIEKLAYPIKSSPFYCRPLFLMCMIFLMALFFLTADIVLYIIFGILIFICTARMIFFDKTLGRGKNPLPYLLLISFVLGSAVYIPGHVNYLSVRSDIKLEEESTVKCVIKETVYSEAFGELYKAQILEIDGKQRKGSAYIEISEQAGFGAYDTVTLKGMLADAQNGESGSEKLRLKAENCCLDIDVSNILSVTNEHKRGLEYRVYEMRQAVGEVLSGRLSVGSASYAKALILGDKSGLSDSFRLDMSALGISHILAVSGLHMSVIAMIIVFFANRFKTARRVKSACIVVGAVAFALLAGLSPSVTRSAIMLIFGILPSFFGGRGDSLTALGVAGVIICAFSPQTVVSCSFMMSFTATLGIVLCASYATKISVKKYESSSVGDTALIHKRIKALALSATASLSASLFTVPALSLYFNEFSFVSVVMNLIAIPIAFISLILVIATLCFGGIPFAGQGIIFLFEGTYGALSGFASFVNDKLITTVSLRYPFFTVILLLFVAILLFLRLREIKNPLSVLGAMVFCALLFGVCTQIYAAFNANRGEICYIAGKSSDGIVVNSGSETLFIDIGNGSRGVLREGMETAAKTYYETGIDGIMLTHYHSDHISTVRGALRQYRVDKLYLPYPENEKDKSFYNSMLPFTEGAEVIMYSRGDILRFNNALIHTLPISFTERSDHPVIAMKIEMGEKAVSFIGASVSESAICVEAERFISSSGAVLCSGHGPVTKENNRFYLLKAETQIFLSPYEDVDEGYVFKNGRFIREDVNENGFAMFRLRLS